MWWLLLFLFYGGFSAGPSLEGSWLLVEETDRQMVFYPSAAVDKTALTYPQIELSFTKDQIILREISASHPEARKHIQTQFFSYRMTSDTRELMSEVVYHFRTDRLFVEAVFDHQLILRKQ